MEHSLIKLKIGYLLNTDTKLYASISEQVIKHLENEGIHVIQFSLKDIGLSVSGQGIDIYLENERVHFDAFMTFGYMSRINQDAYIYILNTFENLNIPKIHSVDAEHNFTNKYLQTICLGKNNLTFPKTNIGFSAKSIKTLLDKNIQSSGVLKLVHGYYSDSFIYCENKESLLGYATNYINKGEFSINQTLIKNEQNKNYKILIINGKCEAITEYEDYPKTNEAEDTEKSKVRLNVATNIPYVGPLRSISEIASKAVGCTFLASVDITLNMEIGFVIKDVNGWPDLISFSDATGIDYIRMFSTNFIEKAILFQKEKSNKWMNFISNLPTLMNKPPEQCDKCNTQFGVQIGINNGVASFLNCDENCYKAEFINFAKEDTGLRKDLMSGMKWQCVEYSRRWLIFNKQITFSSIRMAYNIFDMPFAEDLKTEDPIEFRGLANGGSEPPAFGDLLIFPKSYNAPHGHVAVITGVNIDDGYIEICEQNHEVQIWENPNSYSRRLVFIKTSNENYIFNRSYNHDKPQYENKVEILKNTIIGWKRAIVKA